MSGNFDRPIMPSFEDCGKDDDAGNVSCDWTKPSCDERLSRDCVWRLLDVEEIGGM